MESILVTGGYGFLGAHLVKSLVNDGHKVVVLDLFKPQEGSDLDWLLKEVQDKIHYMKGNITDLASVIEAVKIHQVTKIVHAAVANDLEILKNNPLTSMKINVEGTVNVLEAARLFGVEKVILVSSISVYTPVKYEPIDEDHPVHSPYEGPTLLSYSSSKLSAEAFGLHYWSTYGMDVVSLRLSGVYGFGMKYPMFVKPLVENAVNNKDVHFDSGEHSKRDYTYIKDVVTGIKKALSIPSSQKIFNIATGAKLVSPSEIATIIKEIKPSMMVTFGNERNEIEERSASTRGVLSVEAAKKQLGFNPQYSINQGVMDYFEQYREYATQKKQKSVVE
ncbi:NAD-dependent epimerase/dehydratase family protein [Mesobacillus maritimus]|uniref:NAD-dependent epimerase/dehydratase family protein n=1 Tax=Mesobacillus maritimus TaxID=1643336 RepID=UPI00384C1ACA